MINVVHKVEEYYEVELSFDLFRAARFRRDDGSWSPWGEWKCPDYECWYQLWPEREYDHPVDALMDAIDPFKDREDHDELREAIAEQLESMMTPPEPHDGGRNGAG